jgi:hypothetical protein
MSVDTTGTSFSDSPSLFRIANQVFRARDTAKWLLSRGHTDHDAARRLAQTLTVLTDAVASCVEGPLAAEFDTAIHKPCPEDELIELYVSAAQLSAWLNSVAAIRSFEVSEKIRRADAQKTVESLDRGIVPGEEPEPDTQGPYL